MSDSNPSFFDSRYFGTVHKNQILDVLKPIFTWQYAILPNLERFMSISVELGVDGESDSSAGTMVVGGTGRDKIFAGNGDDVVSGDSGSDFISGGDGDRVVYRDLENGGLTFAEKSFFINFNSSENVGNIEPVRRYI